MSIFCLLSVVFLVLFVSGIVKRETFASTSYLWSSYILLVLCIGGVFLFSKKSPALFSRPPKEIETISTKSGVLEKGKAYMVKEPKNEKTIALFQEAMSKGIPGLYLTRSNPKTMKTSLHADNTSVLWLTELEAPDSINPSDLEEITYTVNQFLNKSKQGFIVIDGLEYLISFVGFLKVLHLIQDLKDTVALRGSILMIPFFESTMESNNLKLLEKEMDVIT